MTLLFSCGGSYVSGLEIVELALMRGLAARGHRVHVLTSGWTDGDFPARLDAAGLPHTRAFTGKIALRRPDWMLDTLRHLPGARRTARRLARELRPDAVVACNRDAALLLAGAFGRVPVLFHIHEVMAPAWVRRVARVADRFVAVSGFVGGTLTDAGIEAGRVSVVHNGVEPAEPAPRTGDPPVVGICGQVGPWKGHDDLIDALALVAARGVLFRLRIYGRGEAAYTDALRARIARHGLGERVEWMGFERDLGRMMSSLDLLAAPSRTAETFGMTLAEAGARGIPAVATRVGGIPEVVADGETGRLVPPEDPGTLAEALGDLLADPAARRALGDAARARVEASFLVPHSVDRFEAVLALR